MQPLWTRAPYAADTRHDHCGGMRYAMRRRTKRIAKSVKRDQIKEKRIDKKRRVSIADVFEVSLDYLVSGSERKTDTDSLLAGLKENEIQFIRNMVLNAIDNMKLLIE